MGSFGVSVPDEMSLSTKQGLAMFGWLAVLGIPLADWPPRITTWFRPIFPTCSPRRNGTGRQPIILRKRESWLTLQNAGCSRWDCKDMGITNSTRQRMASRRTELLMSLIIVRRPVTPMQTAFGIKNGNWDITVWTSAGGSLGYGRMSC